MERIRPSITGTSVHSAFNVKPAAKTPEPKPVDDASEAEQETELTPLAKQLSAAAQRAAARDASLSRQELAELARSISERICGETYRLAKKVHDSFVPATDDPQLLERARQATDFLSGQAENPFKSLGREELSLITYDEGGDFTINERNAAYREIGRRNSEWNEQICRQMEIERRQTGNTDRSNRDIVAHYKSLPPIEEALIRGNYEVDILMGQFGVEIELPEVITSLFAILAEQQQLLEDPDSNERNAGPAGTSPQALG